MSEPTGLARRARRLSDRETGQRMLAAAMAMIDRDGLTVSLEHISFEDVIRQADVARSAVYRRWPHKDLFFSDLVRELATAAIPSAADNDAIVTVIRRVVLERTDELASADGRHGLLVELLRQAALLDFRMLYGSTQWRTYLALHATFMSLPDGALREEVRATLAASQQGFLTRVAAAWHGIADLFGYRLRPDAAVTFETIATLVSAAIRGLIIMAQSMPELATTEVRGSPFGAAQPEEWSLAALGIAGVASSLLEPDPAVEWDDHRISTVRDTIGALTIPPA